MMAEPENPKDPAIYSLRPASIATILLYGGSLLFFMLRWGTVLNYHEARYALAAKEMLARGQWLIPTLLGTPRLEKPPLIYWAIAASIGASGSTSEWAVRLPSAAALLGTALIIGWLTARRRGDRTGLLAALIELTCVYSLIEAQLADPDMLLAVAVAGAMLVFASTTPSGVLFYAAAGVGFLAKGPIALALIFPACLALVIAERDLTRLRFFWNPAGIVMLAAFMLFWPIATYLAEPQALSHWLRENLGRFRGELGHQPLLFYLYTFPWLILPWLPFAVLGSIAVWRSGEAKAPFWQFLAFWFVIGLALLSLSAGKHERYLTPVLPPLSVFAAEGLVAFLQDRPKLRRALPLSFAAIWIAVIVVQRTVVTGYDSYYRGQTELALRTDRQVPAGKPLYLVGIPHNALVQFAYYLSPPLIAVDDVAALRRQLGEGTPREVYIAGPELVSAALAEVGAVEILDRCRTLRGTGKEQERLTFLRVAFQ